MAQWLKKSLKIMIAMAIGAVIIWLSVNKLTEADKIEVLDAFRQTNYWWILAALVVAFISNISRTLRWEQLLKPLGYHPRFINVMLSVLVAYFANLGLPRLGEVMRCGTLKTYDDIPMEKSFGTVVTERLLDLIVFSALFLLNFIIQFDRIHTFVENEIFSRVDIDISNTLYIITVIIIVFFALTFIFRNKVKTLKTYQKIAHVIKGFWEGIKSISKIEKPFTLIFHSLFIWFCYWLMAYLIFQSIPLDHPIGMLEALSTLTIGTVGMILVQGGLGIYPLLVAGTLVTYGFSYPTGYALGWLMWGSQTIGIIICGLTALIIIPHLNKTKKS